MCVLFVRVRRGHKGMVKIGNVVRSEYIELFSSIQSRAIPDQLTSGKMGNDSRIEERHI
jgi:hypothetical protein